MEKLAAEFGLHSLNVEDCMAKFELPKLDSYDNHFFVILSFPPLAEKGYLGYSQLSMFVGRDYLVTIHQGICSRSTSWSPPARGRRTGAW